LLLPLSVLFFPFLTSPKKKKAGSTKQKKVEKNKEKNKFF